MTSFEEFFLTSNKNRYLTEILKIGLQFGHPLEHESKSRIILS